MQHCNDLPNLLRIGARGPLLVRQHRSRPVRTFGRDRILARNSGGKPLSSNLGNTPWRLAGVIDTVGDGGRNIVVMMDARFSDGPEVGLIRYRLLDQTPVKRMDEGTFEVERRTLTVV